MLTLYLNFKKIPTVFDNFDKVWSECKNGEGEWGETLASNALRECEARALHTRGSRLRRFAPSENVQKTTVLQSSAIHMFI